MIVSLSEIKFIKHLCTADEVSSFTWKNTVNIHVKF